MTSWLKMSKTETPESEYRRGFCDGWILAIDALADLMKESKVSGQAAYDIAWQHWHQELSEWSARADGELEYPPELKLEISRR